MIVGHIASGFLVQYYALRNIDQQKIANYPSWCTIIGATLNDIMTAVFLLLGIERIRSNPNFKPLGLDLIYIDWTHSFLMITIWSIIWAAYCHVTVNRTSRGHQVWLYSFIACMTHLLTDYIVHQPDMAPYPNAHTKYGLNLWQHMPIISWIGELLLILAAIGLIRTRYGRNKVRLPMIIMVFMHLMNYPGLFTNIPYILGKIFQNYYSLLRLNVSLAFLGTYLVPGLFISRCLDAREEDKQIKY
jgi:membrane-bound metal-dependent hydrolase YbcI (DUF457 family)